MRRRRNVGPIVALVLIVCASIACIVPSVEQNRLVRAHFNQYFQALHDKNMSAVNRFYHPQTLYAKYYELQLKYPLLGWKITRISGQPWPMDRSQNMNTVSIDCYYKLPDRMLKPQGKYEKIVHPKYGPCGLVPVTLEFSYNQEFTGWYVPRPEYSTGLNWAVPFEKPLE